MTAVAAYLPAGRCHLGQCRSAAAVQRRDPGVLLGDAVPPGGAAVLPPGGAAVLRATGRPRVPATGGRSHRHRPVPVLAGRPRSGPVPTPIAGPLVFAGGLVYLSYLPVHGPTSLTSCLAWSWSRSACVSRSARRAGQVRARARARMRSWNPATMVGAARRQPGYKPVPGMPLGPDPFARARILTGPGVPADPTAGRGAAGCR